jgi:hypothetical protein
MSEKKIGHLLVRVPIFAVTESESWEMPEEYTYIAPGDAELIEHTIPVAWWMQLSEDIAELHGGIELEKLPITKLLRTRAKS